MRIIFWENIVSQHKLPYWNALAASNEVSKFVLIVEQLLYEKLKKQGWENGVRESEKFELHVNPSKETIIALFQEDIRDSYHIFSGIRTIPMVYKVLKLSKNYPINRVLLTESVNINGIRAITRRLASSLIERRYKSNYDIVLGSGANTKKWYLECGVQPQNFYPFLYSIENLKTPENQIEKSENLRFLFIGQLIGRKGLDILLRSLYNVKLTEWTLDVYGEGEDEPMIVNLIDELNLNERVKLHGVVPNSELRKAVGFHDVLILPSRFDGWGAVVNEALASGLKVICSNRCGASILVINDKIGHVFDLNKPKMLTGILEQNIDQKDQIDREYILDYSNYLKGKNVAQYLIAILNFHYKNIGNRPLPPWERFIKNEGIINK